jgi:cyclopropane fatty-acyl-phospholipid synthase-like methyltransferase
MVSNAKGRNGRDRKVTYYKHDFWKTENMKYADVHFRMTKVAWVIRRLAAGRDCDLLDLGCGPGTLGRLMPGNVRYHGIDIAIQEPASNLIEMDLLQSPISFHGKRFDLVVAQGLFEYFGDFQVQKFAEISSLMKPDGKFLVTYMNFAHRKKEVYWPYSNVQQPEDFRRDLERFFVVERSFPGEYNWNFTTPNRALMKAAQAHLTVDIPLVNSLLGINRFYICSARRLPGNDDSGEAGPAK